MAVYTNDLRLKEIATGDESGTWGTSTNTNLSLIAEAFSFGTEAITTNADTHTTTLADGSTDPGRSIFLKYTGTLDSACTITIGPNTISKLWLIENATSGSQNIIIKQGSGATVTIANGQTKAIYSDGAGSGGAMVDAFQDLSIPDLFIDDDLTFTSDSAVITFGADGDTTLTHTDGSGLTLNSTNKLMFNDASQFIQGSSATVLSLGATDEIDLTATAIDVNGTMDVSGAVTANAGVSIDNFTIDGAEIDCSADMTIDVAGDLTLDVSGGDVRIKADGTQEMQFKITDGANVDIISTVSDDDIRLRGNDGGSTITALTLDMSEGGAATFNKGVSLGGDLTFTEDDGVEILARQSLTVTVDSDDDNTGRMFQVRSGASGSYEAIALFSEDVGAVFNQDSLAALDLRAESDNNANMLFVDSGNDRVGIGTNSTNSVLQVATSGTGSIPTGQFNQTVDTNTALTLINSSDSATYAGIKLETRTTQAAGWMIANEYQSAFNGDLVFRSRNAGTASNENFRIKSSGNIIFTGKPATSPIFEMINSDNEDTDTGRETSLRFSGFRSGGEAVNNAQISGHHAGSSDNDNGLMIFFTNNGSGLDEKMRLNFDEIIINQNGNDQDLRVESDNNANMLLVDAGNDVVNIGGVTVETGDQLSVHGSGTNTVQRIYNTNAGTGGSMLIFQKQSSSPADDDNLGDIRFHGNDDAGNLHQFGRILVNSKDVSNGTEDGEMFFQASLNGTATDVLKLGPSTVFNEGGNDINFRIEGDSEASLFEVDAGNDRIGIGIGSPDSRLHVRTGDAGGVTAHANSILTLEGSTTSILQFLTPNDSAQQIRFGDVQDNGAGLLQYDHATSKFQINVNGPERFSINSAGAATFSGNVLCSDILASGSGGLSLQTDEGTKRIIVEDTGHVILGDGSLSTAIDTNGVVSAGDSAYSFSIKNTITSGDPFGILIQYTGMNPNDAGHEFITCFAQSALKHEVRSNGGIANFQSNDANLCDEREKKNIEATASQWALVKGFDIKQFHYNDEADSDAKRLGVIAQEVETYAPQLITDWRKTKQHDEVLWEAGEDLPDGVSVGDVKEAAVEEVLRKGVKEQQMMWMAIKALQEAQTRIETLEAEVAALKGG